MKLNKANLRIKKNLKTKVSKKVKISFIPTHDLGVSIDNLTRNDYYEKPFIK